MARLHLKIASGDESSWLRLALGYVADLAGRRLVCSADAPGRSRQPRADPRARYPMGLHRHPYAELCLLLQGPAVVEFGHARHALAPGDLAMMEPGVDHCEAYARRLAPYTMLWVVGALPLCIGILSVYQPRAGWSVRFRLSLRSRHGQRLFARFADPRVRMQRGWLEPVRADFLSLLAELHQAVLDRRQDAAEPGPRRPQHAAMLRELRAWLDAHLDQEIAVSDLAAMTRLSPNHLNCLFARAHGEPIHAYLLRQRMQTALRLLGRTDMLVKEVARRVGYDDPLYFSRAFRRFHGRSAAQVRSDLEPTSAEQENAP